MAKVTLAKHGPRRMNTKGFIFLRGVPQENVPDHLAQDLTDDPRFIVEFSGSREEVAAPSGPNKPTDDDDIIAAIQEAATQLDEDNEAHWTKSGLPDARALTSILGWVVTAKERDRALISTPPAGDLLDDAAARPSNVRITRKGGTPTPPIAPDDKKEDTPDPTTDGAVDV